MNVNSFVGHLLLVLPADEERAGMEPASHPPNVQVRGDEVRARLDQASIGSAPRRTA